MALETLTGKFVTTVFSNGGFSICSFTPTDETVERVKVSTYGTFTVKGIMPHMEKGEEYEIKVERGEPTKYGEEFNLRFIRPKNKINFNDVEDIKKFLVNITTAKRAEALIDAYGLFLADLLEKGDIKALASVKGVGESTAEKLVVQYELNKDYSEAYIVLGEFGIPTATIQKITNYYKSSEKAIEMVKNNPYEIAKIDGYSFKKCDELFLKIHKDEYNSPYRIRGYIRHYIEEQAGEGHSWTALQKFVEVVASAIGVKNMEVIEQIKYFLDEKELLDVTNVGGTPKVSHRFIAKQELEVANKLISLSDDKTVYKTEGLNKAIEEEQKLQGWDFTEQQKQAISTMASNKVILLEGLAGSGKSTSLKVLLDYYVSQGYTFAQTALSGKASSNLTLITGRDGSTVHRLLGAHSKGFIYNESNKLPYDIIIIDEISMIDIKIFYSLVLALRDSAKLIMIGDSEQLEAIGIPVMKPLIDSQVITRIMLTEIHRQAKKSAVVTHSFAIRQGLVPKTVTHGESVHGELQDLKYVIINDDEAIKEEVARAFYSKLKEGIDIMDIQILSPTRAKGEASCFAINQICQKIYNPKNEVKNEVVLKRDNGEVVLREGDKIINVKNNYKSKTIDGAETPVYNGSIGILKSFEKVWDVEEEKYIDSVIFEFEGIGEIVYEMKDLKMIDLAYCITVHKSQGMGVPHIIVAYPFSYTLVNKQSLYTAITRTKKHCTMILRMKTFQSAVKKDSSSKKRTHLSGALRTLRGV